MTKLFLISTAAVLSIAASPVIASDTRPGYATPTTAGARAGGRRNACRNFGEKILCGRLCDGLAPPAQDLQDARRMA